MNAETKPARHSAPGQYLGFALQPVRVFYHLLTCPKGAKVSLEFKDDVAVHHVDGTIYLEQTKSALRQNPISDWAGDLWKALENWRAMLIAGEIKPSLTYYRLYVTPQKKGTFAEAMAAASDGDAVATLLKTIRTKLSKLKALPGCVAHLQPFLDAPADQQVAIISRFQLETDGTDPLDAIRAVLLPTIAENQIDILIKSGIGQAKQALDRLIQRGKPAILDADAFRKDFHAFIRQNNMPGLLTSLGEVPAMISLSASLPLDPHSSGSWSLSTQATMTSYAPSVIICEPRQTRLTGQTVASSSLAASTYGMTISCVAMA